jgi:hypothetical protein
MKEKISNIKTLSMEVTHLILLPMVSLKGHVASSYEKVTVFRSLSQSCMLRTDAIAAIAVVLIIAMCTKN